MRTTLKSTLALLVAAVVFFVLSASGQSGPGHSSFWANGPSWLGTIGWFGFLICVLLLIASGISALVSRMRRRDRSTLQKPEHHLSGSPDD